MGYDDQQRYPRPDVPMMIIRFICRSIAPKVHTPRNDGERDRESYLYVCMRVYVEIIQGVMGFVVGLEVTTMMTDHGRRVRR